MKKKLGNVGQVEWKLKLGTPTRKTQDSPPIHWSFQGCQQKSSPSINKDYIIFSVVMLSFTGDISTS